MRNGSCKDKEKYKEFHHPKHCPSSKKKPYGKNVPPPFPLRSLGSETSERLGL